MTSRDATLLADACRSCVPFLVASCVGAGDDGADVLPGVANGVVHRFDPFRVGSRVFVSLVHRLHAATAGALAIPRWALYDCGEVPGAVIGFARPATHIPPMLRSTLRVPADHDGLVPLSAVVALPTPVPGAWHLFGLSCASRTGPDGAADDLAPPTLAAALSILPVRTATAALRCDTDDPDLRAYARFAPLEVLTAWTPAHTMGEMLTCRFDVAPPASSGDGVLPPGRDQWLDGDDLAARRVLQAALETGRRFAITGPPRVDAGRRSIPFREIRS